MINAEMSICLHKNISTMNSIYSIFDRDQSPSKKYSEGTV